MKPWALLLVPLSFIGAAVSGTALAVLVMFVHRSMIPDDAFLATGTRMGGIRMFVPPASGLSPVCATREHAREASAGPPSARGPGQRLQATSHAASSSAAF